MGIILQIHRCIHYHQIENWYRAIRRMWNPRQSCLYTLIFSLWTASEQAWINVYRLWSIVHYSIHSIESDHLSVSTIHTSPVLRTSIVQLRRNTRHHTVGSPNNRACALVWKATYALAISVLRVSKFHGHFHGCNDNLVTSNPMIVVWSKRLNLGVSNPHYL